MGDPHEAVRATKERWTVSRRSWICSSAPCVCGRVEHLSVLSQLSQKAWKPAYSQGFLRVPAYRKRPIKQYLKPSALEDLFVVKEKCSGMQQDHPQGNKLYLDALNPSLSARGLHNTAFPRRGHG